MQFGALLVVMKFARLNNLETITRRLQIRGIIIIKEFEKISNKKSRQTTYMTNIAYKFSYEINLTRTV